MNAGVFAIVLALLQVHAVPAPAYHAPAPAAHAAPAPAMHPAPVMRPVPIMHAAPAVHPAPVMRPVPVMHAAPAVHPAPVMHAAPAPRVVPLRPARVAPRYYAPNVSYASGPYHAWHGPVIANPRRWRWWAWNGFVTWYPVQSYWGGGFWGRWSMLNPPVTYGAVADYGDRQLYPSYDAAPYSPGAQLLLDYGLTQTACGPPNLVVIWGPDNSVICAEPNGLVGPGNYELDPATLTLRSSGPAPRAP